MIELLELLGFNIVITIVDSMSKKAYFILTHTTVTMEHTAKLFLHHVWKPHGFPSYFVLDRGPQFVTLFTKKLYCLLGVEIASSTA